MASTSTFDGDSWPALAAARTLQKRRAIFCNITREGVASLPALLDALEFEIHIPMEDGWQSRTKIVPEEHKTSFTSRVENSNAEMLNSAFLEPIMDNLQCTHYQSLWLSLITAISNQEPTNKIPVYLQHCAYDPLRDDVKIYGQLLESRGVPIKIDLFPEDGHQTWSLVSPPSKWKNPTIPEG
jgi:hypothetical protein